MTEAVETRIRKEERFRGIEKSEKKPAQIFFGAYGKERNDANRASAAGRTDVTGENTGWLEQTVAAYINVKAALAVSSGRMALYLAIRLAAERIAGSDGETAKADREDTGETAEGGVSLCGRRVFCPDFASEVNAAMILGCGGMPVFIDASSDDWGMDPEALANAFERYPEVKLVIVSHVYGFPGRIDEIKEICGAHGALLIEDASEALGAKYKGHCCGSFGDYGILDFESAGMKGEDAGTNEGAAGGTVRSAGMDPVAGGNAEISPVAVGSAGADPVAAGNVGGMLLINGKDWEKSELSAEAGKPHAEEQSKSQMDPAETAGGQGSAQEPGYERTDAAAGEIRGLLKKLEEQIAGRIAAKKRIYERYADRLAELDVWMNPYDEENAEPNYQTPCMMISENGLSQARWNLRDGRWTYEYDDVHGRTCPPELSDVLGAFGVKCGMVWRPLHLLPLYQGFDFVTAEEEIWDGESGCEDGTASPSETGTRAGVDRITGTAGEGEYLSERCLCLPSDVGMTEEEQERVIEMVRSCFDSCAKVDGVGVRY